MMQGEMTEKQRNLIFAELAKIDMSKVDLEDSLEFSVKDLSKQDASDLITGLKDGKLNEMIEKIKKQHAPKGGIYDAVGHANADAEAQHNADAEAKKQEREQKKEEVKEPTATPPTPIRVIPGATGSPFAGWTREQIDLIKLNFAYGATDTELAFFLEVARIRRLNPLLGEIKWVRRRKYDKSLGKWVETASIIIGIDGARRKAQESGKMDGIDVDVIRESGKITYGIATLYLRGSSHPIIARAPWDEYCAKDRDGNVTQFWMDKAETMIKKVAEFTAYRMAFASELGGMYIDEEMQQAGEPINAKIEDD